MTRDGTNTTFQVPDSCRAMVENGNSISADVIEDTIENDSNDHGFCLLRKFGNCLEFFILQDKY
jgi:hypothetical protein